MKRRPSHGEHANEKVAVYFSPRDNLGDRLAALIESADGGVLACTAWITDERVLSALQRANCVSLIVQNDDFAARGTRRGPFASSAQYERWAQRVAEQWSAIKGAHATAPHGVCQWIQRHYPTLTSVRATVGLSAKERAWAARVCETTPDVDSRSLLETARRRWVIDGVRAHGERATTRQAHVARMHHKFVVVFRGGEPIGVWTGSYNPTRVAEQSAENAVWIEDARIATEFAHEHMRLLLTSEPVRWTSRHRAPIWGCAHAGYAI